VVIDHGQRAHEQENEDGVFRRHYPYVTHDEKVGDAKHGGAVQQRLQHARHAVATLEQ
jgi:hypothetical protein